MGAGERDGDDKVIALLWPGKDGVPGNAHTNGKGEFDRLADLQRFPAEYFLKAITRVYQCLRLLLIAEFTFELFLVGAIDLCVTDSF